MSMGSSVFSFEIPADVLESAKMSVGDAKLELAIALFSQERLSMGKAAELAGIPVGQFQLQLGTRKIGMHYGVEEALEDKAMLAAMRAG
jgi:predicted HTH domain antitoxin